MDKGSSKKPTKKEINVLARKIFKDYEKSKAGKKFIKLNNSIRPIRIRKNFDDLLEYNKYNFEFMAEWHLNELKRNK